MITPGWCDDRPLLGVFEGTLGLYCPLSPSEGFPVHLLHSLPPTPPLHEPGGQALCLQPTVVPKPSTGPETQLVPTAQANSAQVSPSPHAQREMGEEEC